MRRSFFVWVLSFGLLFACATEAQTAGRCGSCGMRVDATALAAGATGADGAVLSFDSAKCMFRYLGEHAGTRDAWATDYYTRARAPIEAAFFVRGSDVLGAMGPDVIAFGSRAEAERFARDHHGSVLSRAEVTAAVIDELFGAHAHG